MKMLKFRTLTNRRGR